MPLKEQLLNTVLPYVPTIALFAFTYCMLCLVVTPAVWYGQRLARIDAKATFWDSLVCSVAFFIFSALNVQAMLNLKMLLVDKSWIFAGLNPRYVCLALTAGWIGTAAISGMAAGAVFSRPRHQIVGYGAALVPLALFGYLAV